MRDRPSKTRMNFWTVIKNIKDIEVDDKTKDEIIKMRAQHAVLADEVYKTSPKLENNLIVVTQHDVENFYELWDQMSKIRNKIEKIIRLGSSERVAK
jgi:D-ribose pyranose/furanose isomerase RbsD